MTCPHCGNVHMDGYESDICNKCDYVMTDPVVLTPPDDAYEKARNALIADAAEADVREGDPLD